MIYYSSKEPFDFNTFKTIRSFAENIYSGKIAIKEADQEQADLSEYILNFNNKAIPKYKDDKKNTRNVFNTAKNLYEGGEAHTITINSKYLLQHAMIILNYQMDRILYQIFKIFLGLFKKERRKHQ